MKRGIGIGLIIALCAFVGLGAAYKIVNRLNDLNDVAITSPADGAVLTYSAATTRWTDAAVDVTLLSNTNLQNIANTWVVGEFGDLTLDNEDIDIGNATFIGQDLELSAGATLGGDLDMQGQNITNVGSIYLTNATGSVVADTGQFTNLTAVTQLNVPGVQTNASLQVTNLNAITTAKLPSSDDPDVSVAGQLSWDTDGWLRAYDGSAQVAVGRKIEQIDVTIYKPQDLDDAQRDALPVWANKSGMSFVVTGWAGWSSTDDTTLNIEEIDGDGQNNATVDAVELATNGTGWYYGSDTTITAATIEDGHMILLDFDDTDSPGVVKLTIYGYYGADVN